MSDTRKKRIAEFEKTLDAQLASLPGLEEDGFESIRILGDAMELAFLNLNLSALHDFHNALNVLLPELVLRGGSYRPNTGAILKDVIFASEYWTLRDLLYYSYNVPGAIEWNFQDRNIDINFKDLSIPRQLYLEHNVWFLLSEKLSLGFAAQDEILQLLTASPIDLTLPHVVDSRVHELIAAEVKTKVSTFFDVLDPDDTTDLGGYSYSAFRQVYVFLLEFSIYCRYLSKAKKAPPTTRVFARGQLELLISGNVNIDQDVLRCILRDISFSRSSGVRDATMFPLIYLEEIGETLLIPTRLSLFDGFVKFLRQKATRSPNIFLSTISDKLGKWLVQRTAADWRQHGFKVRENVLLTEFKPELPDIDLMVFSKEPTLGVHLFVCEVKNPIPATWAKEQLRALGKSGNISKAFRQLDAILAFLVTEAGTEFLFDSIRAVFPDIHEEFPKGFVVPMQGLVITSQSMGMFFGDEKVRVVNREYLRAILENSDGDVVYVKGALDEIGDYVDKCIDIIKKQIEVGEFHVDYSFPTMKALLRFQKIEYKSKGIDKLLREQGIRDDYSFITSPVFQSLVEKSEPIAQLGPTEGSGDSGPNEVGGGEEHQHSDEPK